MTVIEPPEMVGKQLPGYGVYVGKYVSEHAQVKAELFRENGNLAAHLSYNQAMPLNEFTDAFRADLEQLANERRLALKIFHMA